MSLRATAMCSRLAARNMQCRVVVMLDSRRSAVYPDQPQFGAVEPRICHLLNRGLDERLLLSSVHSQGSFTAGRNEKELSISHAQTCIRAQTQAHVLANALCQADLAVVLTTHGRQRYME